ncbi:HNH endonuclease domain-containing protein [Enterobacter sp. DE0047]|uniref:HNH endonuclease n=1 Tax=Enterobacter sp. DE0047 TaxID=2584949 RepID=UPI0011A25DFA|nr:HNH endonuclease domain-containing protein [Enterobacter sp. DE0047]
MIRNNRTLKLELWERFKHQCAYCGTKLYEPLMADVAHFFPKSKYPAFQEDTDNLLIACKACNMIKRDQFPLDDNGQPLLLNPVNEIFSKHIKQSKNGYLEGLTERGHATIEVLQLNRSSLIEQRILDIIDMQFADDRSLSEHDVYMTFKSSMLNAIKLNNAQLQIDGILQIQMTYMLYANVITSLETYLCDRFISLIQGSQASLRSFVENFKDYNQEKFSLSELFIKHEEIESKAIKSMKSVLYHDLPKVSGMYRDTFGIIFPIFSDVYKSVLIRHDLVHRAGKTKNGDFHQLNPESVKEVVKNCSDLVEQLENELKDCT